MSADLETLLFARFRDRADVGALGELYDRTAAELLRVAFHLVRDPARAEDLVQQTFVAAIEGAARFDATRAVRAWLLGILANQARKLQRAEARVPPGGSEASIDPLAVAQTEEFTAQVDAAISTLPEVYQPVLVLHLKHDMIAAEIAHALRRPPGTVRTQLMRALDLLKRALPASIALGAGVLLMPLRGLAAVKQVVLANAASRVAAGVAAGAGVGVGVASLVGGTVAMKKLVAALVLAVLVCGGAFAWLELDRPLDANTSERDAASLVQVALPAPEVPPAAADAPVATEREQVVAPTHGSLRYRFLWEEDRTPAVGVLVHFVVWGRPNPHIATIDARTDDAGEIALGELEPGGVGIYVDRAGGASPKVVAGEESVGTVLIPRGITVDVAVQDEQQQPIAGARVWLSHYGNGEKGHEVGVTNAMGRLTIRDVGEARQVGARTDRHAPTDLCSVTGKPCDRVAVTLTMAATCASLHGTVRDAAARPVPGARVQVGGFARVKDAEPGFVANSPPPPIEVLTDGNGRYEVRGVPAEEIFVRARGATSGATWQLLTLGAGEVRQVDVTLPAGASIVGFVRDEEGRGLADAWIGGGDDYGGFGYCSARSGANGAFVLQGLPAGGRVAVSVSLERYLKARETFALSDGEQRAFDFVLKTSGPDDQISGTLVDEQDRPLAKWIVNIRPVGDVSAEWWAYLHTDTEGCFVARGCPDRVCVLEVFDPDAPGSPYALVSRQDVRRGMNDLRVTVPAAALRFASLSGRIVDPDGMVIEGAQVSVRDPDVPTYRQFPTDAGGRFRAERLPPRTYRLDIAAAGLPIVALGERTLAPHEQLELGTIVMPRGGRIALNCTFPVPDQHWSASVATAAGENVDWFDSGNHPYQSRLLAPGRYRLFVTADNFATAARDVEITDGQATNVDVALERGCRHTLDIREPKAGAWHRLDIHALDAHGRAVWGFDGFARRGNESIGFGVTLGAGTWQVQAKTDTGLAGSATIHVADVTLEPAPVVVDLR